MGSFFFEIKKTSRMQNDSANKTLKWIVQPEFHQLFDIAISQLNARKDSTLSSVQVIPRSAAIHRFTLVILNVDSIQTTDSGQCNRQF